MGNDVTVPIKQTAVLFIKAADFTAFFEIIAGIAMMEVAARLECVPLGNQNGVVSIQYDVIF